MTIEHSNIDYSERIPNNVGLADNRRLRRALESWQPNYLKWWQELGPDQSTKSDVYLRTAVSVERDGICITRIRKRAGSGPARR